ncbi:uncharacterized protein LOC143024569 [Oratosquilla oratoria]|uniref:uncharacterized protein LOC143024569 n=1 Tax=Oratosquilla oratoria TaxID=337810 RepID=UPI003F772650
MKSTEKISYYGPEEKREDQRVLPSFLEDVLEDDEPESISSGCFRKCQFFDTALGKCNFDFDCLECVERYQEVDVDDNGTTLCPTNLPVALTQYDYQILDAINSPCRHCYYKQYRQCLVSGRCQTCKEYFVSHYGLDMGRRLAARYCR